MSEKVYKKLDQREHVLKRPDTYIGSIENVKEETWILDDSKESIKSIIYKEITKNSGLEQLIMELIVNVVDHSRTSSIPVKNINITIEKDFFTITNDGKGIPLTYNNEHKVYIPEMIFSQLLTGSNFDDNVVRTTGGKNGIGAKACAIFSKKFSLDLMTNGTRYTQSFENNLTLINKPVIKESKAVKNSKKDYVSITFYPDFARFGLTSFEDNDNMSIIKKRLIDGSAMTPGIKWYLNEKDITVKNFVEYTELYKIHNMLDNTTEKDIETDSQISGSVTSGIPKTKQVSFESEDHRWKIVVVPSIYKESTNISFVNGICTTVGGTHIKYIQNMLIKNIKELLSKSRDIQKLLPDNEAGEKDYTKIDTKHITNSIMIFLSAIIDNPSFTSQTKVELSTLSSKFGTKCELPIKFAEDIIKKLDLKKIIASSLEDSMNTKLLKAISAGPTSKNADLMIEKYIKAANAGKKGKSKGCILILTEGDSAKTFVTNGMIGIPSTVMQNPRDYIGIFPLKGKPLNSRAASIEQMIDNKEFKTINKILGLNTSAEKRTTSIDDLNYGRVMILSDSDSDGNHIKGLLLSYFTQFWPEIISNDFVISMKLPVAVVTKTRSENRIPFYSTHDLNTWIEEEENVIGHEKFTVKYYKGLGTSSELECVSYFNDILNLMITYKYDNRKDSDDNKAISLFFDEKQENNRKEMVISTTKKISNDEIQFDSNANSFTICDFLMNQMSLFSVEDTQRSLPSIMDGFKPSQRKIVHGLLEDNVYKEVKVSVLTGKITEKTHYAHGEASMNGAITNMSQTFIGSGNNLPVLKGIGGFGSRDKGGKDAASPRYISAHLEPYAKILFNKDDIKILKRNIVEGHVVEPEYYIPIVPLVLLNGPEGIGTGFASSIPSFKFEDVVENLRLLLKDPNNQLNTMTPYYNGFRGSITLEVPKGQQQTATATATAHSGINSKWICKGLYERLDGENGSLFKIKDLPIGLWYDNFTEYTNQLVVDGVLEYCRSNDFYDCSTGYKYTEYTVKFNKESVTNEEAEKKLKLVTSISGRNFTGFDKDGIIRKYEHAQEILYLFYKSRLQLYSDRKDYLLKILRAELFIVSEKARFIKLVVDDKLILNKRSKLQVENDLIANKFKKVSVTELIIDNGTLSAKEVENCSYDYLTNMYIISLTIEKIDELNKKKNIIEKDIEELENTKVETMWLNELDDLEEAVNEVKSKNLAASNKQFKNAVGKEKTTKATAKKTTVTKPRTKKA